MTAQSTVVSEAIEPMEPQADWRDLVQAVKDLPPGKAVRVTSDEAGPEGPFRSAITAASARVGVQVSTNKHDGYYLIQRRFEMIG